MKLAVSHDKEVRLGWANVVARPVVSARSSAPATSMPNMRATPPRVVLPSAGLLKVQRFLSTSKDAKSRLPEPMLQRTLPPLLSMLVKFVQILFNRLRLTSVILTCKLTCNGVEIGR